MQKIALIISILLMAGMATAAPSSDLSKASQTPGDALYFLDKFSEKIELQVAKAPVIGGPDLEAKVRANNAAERLSEAKKLAEQNKSEKVDKLMEDYSRQVNLSTRMAKKANNTNLSRRLENVSNNHVKTLHKVQKKVPEQAQKGIQNAIENSQKNQRELRVPEKAQKKGRPEDKRPKQSGKPEISDLTESGKQVDRDKGLSNSPVDQFEQRTPEEVEKQTQETTEQLKEMVKENTTEHKTAGNNTETDSLENLSDITAEDNLENGFENNR